MTAGRGQSGLDRVAVFLLAVVVLLLVAPTVLGFVGVDVRESEASDDRAVELTTLGAEGVAVDADRSSVGAVRVVVTNTGGGAVDPGDLTATWVGNGTYTLVAAGADGGSGIDATFAVAPVDENRDGAALRDHGDRAVLTFDLGTDDVEGAGEFADRLGPGETATVTLVTPGGASTTADLAVPEPLPAGDSIAL